MKRATAALLVSALARTLAACSDGGPGAEPPKAEPLFPADYASTYTEVRDCRQSGDHDLNVIRILADPAALSPYLDRDAPFPVGAIVLKEEYDFSDVTCAGPVLQWTVMARLADGSSVETLDWRWQQVDRDRNVTSEDLQRCHACHSACTIANGGYESTCAVP